MLYNIESAYALFFAIVLIALLLVFNKNKFVIYVSVFGPLFLFWSTIVVAVFYNNYIIFERHYAAQNFVHSSKFLMNLETGDVKYPLVIDFSCKLDSLNLTFLISTALIFFVCTISSVESYFHDEKSLQKFLFLLFLTEGFTILAFLTANIFYFYVFFESVLSPMCLIILIWGSQKRRVVATYLFFMYTLVFSFMFLYGIVLLSTWVPDMSVSSLKYFLSLNFDQERFMWICVFLAFAVKIPVFPFHGWSPEAHVEAPTIGSVVSASILLKLGGYGSIKFLIPILPLATLYLRPLVVYLCILGSIYGACMASIQLDIKKILAYSSIAHMNFAVPGLFSSNINGFSGALVTFVSHAFISAGLSYLVGALYRRFSTRDINRYGGLSNITPVMSFFFMFFISANMSSPPALSFVGELFIFMSFFDINNSYGALIFFIIFAIYVPTLLYNIRLYVKVFHGDMREILYKKSVFCEKKILADVTLIEFLIASFLVFVTILLGLKSTLITDLILVDPKIILNLL